MYSNSEDDKLKRRYEESMKKVNEKIYSDLNTTFNSIAQENQRKLKEELDLIDEALKNGDTLRAQTHSMNARMYRMFLGW